MTIHRRQQRAEDKAAISFNSKSASPKSKPSDKLARIACPQWRGASKLLLSLVCIYTFAIASGVDALSKSVSIETGLLVERWLSSGDFERRYLIYVPTTYRQGTAAPLVVVFHGGGGTSESIARTSRMHEIAEREGFITVYPNGLGRGGLSGRASWNTNSIAPVGWAERTGVDDVGFVAAVIKDVSKQIKIDSARIYAAGMSKGGMMAYHAACEMAGTFQAIAVVAGTLSSDECPTNAPVAILHIHGTADENVPLDGGTGAFSARRANWPAVDRGLLLWRDINRCKAEPTIVFEGEDTTCTSWTDCDKSAVVEVCLVDGGGHAWPGAEPAGWQIRRNIYVSQLFDASRFIWSFFTRHPQ